MRQAETGNTQVKGVTAVVTDRLAQAVRQQLRLGRLLPLGGQPDGAWLTEHAADDVLRRASDDLPGVRLGGLSITLADPDTAATPAVPAPPSALPPGGLRIEAEFAATADEPLLGAADRLRDALFGASARRLGLHIGTVDLRVTEVLDELPPARRPTVPPEPEPQPAEGQAGGPERAGLEAAAAEAARGVPGVARLAPALANPNPVHIEGAHIRIELAVAAEHRALDVARAVRAAVADAVPSPALVTVAVLVTAVD